MTGRNRGTPAHPAKRASRPRKGRRKRRSSSLRFLIVLTVLLLIITGLLFFDSKLFVLNRDFFASGEGVPSTSPSDSTVHETSDHSTTPPQESTLETTGSVPDETEPSEPTEPPDLEPPIISGAQDLIIQVGDKVSYRRGVTVEDNRDESLSLQIDSSNVNIREPGIYPLVYYAEDMAGNLAQVEIRVTVIEKTQSQQDPDALFLMADEILAEITEPQMSQLEQAEAIYNWTKRHISYVNHSDKTSWIDGAWQGVTQGSGDCFNYFATAKLLLTRAGISNMDVIKTTGSHFWSLVDTGDGWYHFDTTQRKSGGEFFMLTDAELTAYSNQHRNTHVWDQAIYPATPEVPLQ